MTRPVHLAHRSVLFIGGGDAASFLDGLLTQSIAQIEAQGRAWAALLSPQGKVLADMLLERCDGGFLADCALAAHSELLQRLARFRLRAQVELAPRDDLCVMAFEGTPDPRAAGAPHRRLAPITDAHAPSDLDSYHAARIAAGLAESPMDFAAGEVFPADINMDLLGGVDFRKGCFVGQEVVSRMKRRGTARRRTLCLMLEAPILLKPQEPAVLMAGADEIGVVTSHAGKAALARLRIDRLAEADAAGLPLTVNGVGARVVRPDWLASEIAALKAG